MKSSDETREMRSTIKDRQQPKDRWMALASAIIGGWIVAGVAGTVIAVCFSKSAAHPDVWGIDWHGVRAFFVVIASGWLAGRHLYLSELGDQWDRHEAESVHGSPSVDDPHEWRVMCVALLVGNWSDSADDPGGCATHVGLARTVLLVA